MEEYRFFAGIDVAKRFLDVAVAATAGSPARSWRVEQNTGGLKSLSKELGRLGRGLVVLEATGGLEKRVVSWLSAAGQGVAVLNPRQVRYLAKGTGRAAKTDKVDALFLAQLAEMMRPQPRRQRTIEEEELSALVGRRAQVQQMITAEHNREEMADSVVRRDVAAHRRYLERQLSSLDERISARLDQPAMARKGEVLSSMPGVGPVTTATLLSSLPELGLLEKRYVARLVGVAPLNNDSGERRGKMSCWGGRPNVRAVLYMATLVAIRHNPAIKSFYHNLTAARLPSDARPPKVALVACMHKLLTILNAMLRDQRPWSYQSRL